MLNLKFNSMIPQGKRANVEFKVQFNDDLDKSPSLADRLASIQASPAPVAVHADSADPSTPSEIVQIQAPQAKT